MEEKTKHEQTKTIHHNPHTRIPQRSRNHTQLKPNENKPSKLLPQNHPRRNTKNRRLRRGRGEKRGTNIEYQKITVRKNRRKKIWKEKQ